MERDGSRAGFFFRQKPAVQRGEPVSGPLAEPVDPAEGEKPNAQPFQRRRTGEDYQPYAKQRRGISRVGKPLNPVSRRTMNTRRKTG